MATPINILINDVSLLDYFEHVSIKFTEGLFCNSIDISVKDKNLWNLFDPIANFGQMKMKVLLGEMTYEFMTEERSTDVPLSGVEFTVWGRSAQALLDRPYSNLIHDDEEKIHPWQLGDCTVSQIITYVMNYCCSNYIRSKVAVYWNVENFTVYKDSFSTSYNSPIEIISSLAAIIGAELVANADGSLTIQEYSVAEGVAIQDYNDLDHIVSLNDDIVYPIGFNSVTVNGYGTGEDTKAASLSVELLEDDLPGWVFGKDRMTRCYYYHPQNLGVDASVLRGRIKKAGAGKEEFTEWVLLVWGQGNTSRPNLEGETVVTGDEDIPLEFTEVTYQCKYQDFALASLLVETDEPEYGVASYYFTDRSNTQTLTFEYYEKEGDIDEQRVIQLDWDEPEEDENGNPIDPDTGKPTGQRLYTYFWRAGLEVNPDIIYRKSSTKEADTSSSKGPAIMLVGKNQTDDEKRFRIWGPHWDLVERVFDSMYADLTPDLSEEGTLKKLIEEEIGFSGGEGSISRPFYEDGSVHWLTKGGGDLIFVPGTTTVKIAKYNEETEFPFAIGKVSYYSNLVYGMAKIPKAYTAKEYCVHLEKVREKNTDGSWRDKEFLSISQSIDNEDIPPDSDPATYKSVAIVVKDFATDVVIQGATVYVDGSLIGTTNETGTVTMSSCRIGDHTIRITSPGYLDSDEDELANDTFTVS